jgi:hypothetical protein
MATGAGVNGASDDRPRWDLLEAQPPAEDRLTVRTAVSGRHPDVLIALDAARRRHVLVELPVGEIGEIVERTSRGIAVQTVELRPGSDSTKRYIEIVCLEAQGDAALDTIAVELVDALEAGASIGRVRLVQNVLAKWLRFWSGVSQGVLSKEQQLGLFGELWFLSRWLAPAMGIESGVKMWRGPAGARNDFESRGAAIEVKTSGRLDGTHVINGLDQLLEPPGGGLMLFSLLVRDEASGAESLPALVQETRGLIAEDHALHSQFDALLYAVGYDDRLSAEYLKLNLRIRGEALYEVSGEFPRLVPASFVSGLPVGVSSLQYDLRLDAAGAWMLAANPAAAAAHLKRTST